MTVPKGMGLAKVSEHAESWLVVSWMRGPPELQRIYLLGLEWNLNLPCPKKRIGRLFLGEQKWNSFFEWKSGDLFFEMGNHCWLRGKVSFKTAGPKKIPVVVPKDTNTQEIQKRCKWNMKWISSQLPVNLSNCHRDEGHTVKHRWLLEWLQVRILFLFVAHYLKVVLTPSWILGGSPLETTVGLSCLTRFQLESNHAFLEKEIPFQYHHFWGFCGSSQTDTATPKVTSQRTMDYFWEVKFAGDVFSDVKMQSIFSWIFQPK